MKRSTSVLIAIGLFLGIGSAYSQVFPDAGRFSGNFQVDAQYYQKDNEIGAETVPEEKILSNSFFNLIYNLNSFEVGFRYESYLGPISGFDPRYEGNGISYRYATYRSDIIDITAGNFYEQFGSGMIFRAYEERQLGYDNAMDGVKVKLRPVDGLTLTGIIGKQRNFWDLGKGLVRGADVEFALTDVVTGLVPDEYSINLGASVISKYEDSVSTQYVLPANTLAYALRTGIFGPTFNVDAEYAYKYNDPHASNRYSYNPGQALLLNASYFTRGLGVALNLHRVDNMDFRSERGATSNSLLINFIPPLTKQQTYRLATVYPFSTQLNGEVGAQAEITYKIPKKTLLGGKYGTNLSFNFSVIKAIDSTATMMDTVNHRALEYDAPFFSTGDRTFFRDLNFAIEKKWNKELKTKFTYINQTYDRDIVENMGAAKYGQVKTNIAIAEIQYKLSRTNTIRTEIQHLWASQDSAITEQDYTYGNWLVVLAEYTISPSFYFSVWDEFNYFDEEKYGETIDRSLHYLNASFAYVHEATRVSIGYGRQREGLLCVGGVCRQVPASNGFFLSVTSSF